MPIADDLDLVFKCFALAGGLFAVYRYYDEQRWRRTEFVNREVDAFLAQPRVQVALRLLDFNAIRINPDTGTFALPGRGIAITDAHLVRAIMDHNKIEDPHFTDEEAIAREAFDELFTRLERFSVAVSQRLISPALLEKHLQYWLKILFDPRSGRKPPEFAANAVNFARAYGYDGVLALARQLGVHVI
jgi:hypothetical protein